jgi:hypothetical protein
VLVEGREYIPRGAIEAGRDKDNNSIYIARAYFEDGLRTSCLLVIAFASPLDAFSPACIAIGKASSIFKEGAVIGYGGRVVEVRRSHHIHGKNSTTREYSSTNSKYSSAIPERYGGSLSAVS